MMRFPEEYEAEMQQLRDEIRKREEVLADFERRIASAHQLLKTMSSRLVPALAAETHADKRALLVKQEFYRVCIELHDGTAH